MIKSKWKKRHDIDRQKDIKPPSVLKALDYNKKNASKKNSIELCLLNKLSIYIIIEYWEKLFKVTYISVLSQWEDTALYLMVAAIDSCQIYSTRLYSCTAVALQKKKNIDIPVCQYFIFWRATDLQLQGILWW